MRRKRRSKCSRTRLWLLVFLATVILSYFGTLSSFMTLNGKDLPTKSSVRPGTGYVKPPLTDLIQGWNITRNVTWLLDFAVVGFPKTGTSSLMTYLQSKQDSIFIFGDERCDLGWNQHVVLLQDLYKHYQPHLRMGIKCPNNLEVDLAMKNFNAFFPKTKFIVGLRHPVLWLESLYNHRVNNYYEMPPAQKVVGKCRRFNQGVCTVRTNFSKHMSQIEPFRKVFLYEVSQLKPDDLERSRLFRQDLSDFLELSTPLPDDMPWGRPGIREISDEDAKELVSKRMNICDEENHLNPRSGSWTPSCRRKM